MKSIIFTFDNIRKIETFLNGKVLNYWNGYMESAEFEIKVIEGELEKTKSLKFEKGDVIYKDRQSNIFKKLN